MAKDRHTQRSNIKATVISLLFTVAAYHLSKQVLFVFFSVNEISLENLPVEQLLLAVIALIVIRSAYLIISGIIFFRISRTTSNAPVLLFATMIAIYGILVVDISTPISMHAVGVLWTYLCVFFGFKLGSRYKHIFQGEKHSIQHSE